MLSRECSRFGITHYPTLLENYRPITLANAIYKLRTICIVILATDYIESRKILSPEQVPTHG